LPRKKSKSRHSRREEMREWREKPKRWKMKNLVKTALKGMETKMTTMKALTLTWITTERRVKTVTKLPNCPARMR